ncbi:MAG: glycosyltransferase [Desulfobacterales bacterium]|nr:MAG: glycosyltransferase [Desulfobacterales bacterium]
MKVALVIHSNILNKIDGMTSYYKRLCRYAAAKRHQLDVFMQDPAKSETLQHKSGRFFLVRVKASFQPLPEAYLSFNPFLYIKLAWYFHGVFKREKYSCLQVASAHPMSLSAIAAAKRLGIPVIGSYHTLLPEYARYWSYRRFASLIGGKFIAWEMTAFVSVWTRLVYGAADMILVPTSKVRFALKKIFRHKRIEVIGRGVEADMFRPRRTAGPKLTALYVGRVSVEKDLEKLIFFRRHKDIQLKIVGDGKDIGDIRKKLPFADFKGSLQDQDLAREYRHSDIFVFPSKTDAYANVVSEALCSGLPVVAFDTAGVDDRVKDGINGFLVEGDADFENAVLKLKNGNLREKMSHMARQTALSLKWEAVFEKQLSAFKIAIYERQQKLKKFFPILRQVLYAFNFSHALLGSARMGFYVFLANASAGLAAGFGAGMRQSFISFLMVGFNTSFFEFLYFRSRKLSIILPSILTTTVGTTIHLFSGTPNIPMTAATILGLALFNFTMLSEIHRRHETISPWELTKIFTHYLITILRRLRRSLKKKLDLFKPQLQAILSRSALAKPSK